MLSKIEMSVRCPKDCSTGIQLVKLRQRGLWHELMLNSCVDSRQTTGHLHRWISTREPSGSYNSCFLSKWTERPASHSPQTTVFKRHTLSWRALCFETCGWKSVMPNRVFFFFLTCTTCTYMFFTHACTWSPPVLTSVALFRVFF